MSDNPESPNSPGSAKNDGSNTFDGKLYAQPAEMKLPNGSMEIPLSGGKTTTLNAEYQKHYKLGSNFDDLMREVSVFKKKAEAAGREGKADEAQKNLGYYQTNIGFVNQKLQEIVAKFDIASSPKETSLADVADAAEAKPGHGLPMLPTPERER